jgi:hypothetical protein
MHHPQLLVYEPDRRLAALLQPLADKNRWLLREPRQPSAWLRLFSRGGPGVLVFRAGRANAEYELTTLEQLTWLYPEAATVFVGDSDQTFLANLAWDVGVSYVLLPPQTRERLPEIVASLMKRYQPESPAAGGEV